MILYSLTVAVFVLQLFDWYSTRTILGRSGYEKNPVAAAGMDAFGVDGYLAIKTVIVTGLGYVAGSASIWLIAILVAIYVCVIGYNWKSMP